jgi:hypothetical protein
VCVCVCAWSMKGFQKRSSQYPPQSGSAVVNAGKITVAGLFYFSDQKVQFADESEINELVLRLDADIVIDRFNAAHAFFTANFFSANRHLFSTQPDLAIL